MQKELCVRAQIKSATIRSQTFQMKVVTEHRNLLRGWLQTKNSKENQEKCLQTNQFFLSRRLSRREIQVWSTNSKHPQFMLIHIASKTDFREVKLHYKK